MRRTPTDLCSSRLRGALLGLLALGVGGVVGPRAQEQAPADPWRLDRAADTPDWLRLSGEVQLRYEGYEGQYRAPRFLDSSDGYGVNRVALRADVDLGDFGGTVELMDARQFGAGEGSVINNTVVNPIDILQAYGEYRWGGEERGRQSLKVGRYTTDLGSRRLVARNRFRNTINAFSGVEWNYAARDEGSRATLFWAMPVLRLPFRRSDLLDNEIQFDEQDKQNQFFGGFYSIGKPDDDLVFEVYAYRLDEQDRLSRRRRLYTPGFRIFRKPAAEQLHYELEVTVQFGETGPFVNRFDKLAYYHHVSAGYTFDAPWKPRISAAWDYASGDRDPFDGDDGRFDTLFGVNREYGPVGIYAPIARRNINTPELRGVVKPLDDLTWMVAARYVWLAQAKDFAPRGGVRDPSGAAGDHFGEQIETKLAWDVTPKGLRFEFGAAYLWAGRFLREAPNARGEDVAYAYTQMHWTF